MHAVALACPVQVPHGRHAIRTSVQVDSMDGSCAAMGVIAANLSLLDAGIALPTSVAAMTCGAFLCRTARPDHTTVEVVAGKRKTVATEDPTPTPHAKPWLTPMVNREVRASAQTEMEAVAKHGPAATDGAIDDDIVQATYLLDLTALEEEFVDAAMVIAHGGSGLITACQLDVTEPIPLEIVLEMVDNAAAGSIEVLGGMDTGADPDTITTHLIIMEHT